MRIALLLLALVRVGSTALADEQLDDLLRVLEGPSSREQLKAIERFATRAESVGAVPRIIEWIESRPGRAVLGCIVLQRIVETHRAGKIPTAFVVGILRRRDAEARTACLVLVGALARASLLADRDRPDLYASLVPLTASQNRALSQMAAMLLQEQTGKKLGLDSRRWKTWYERTYRKPIDLRQGIARVVAFVEVSPDNSYRLNGAVQKDTKELIAELKRYLEFARTEKLPLTLQIYAQETSKLRSHPAVRALLTEVTRSGIRAEISITSSKVDVRPLPNLPPITLSKTYIRHENIVYGERRGKPLVLDVFEPKKANGRAIVWAVSRTWQSSRGQIERDVVPWIEPLVKEGYTVFAVVHGSVPDSTVRECVADLGNAVAFVAARTKRWRISKKAVALVGFSSGGQLALLVAFAPRLAEKGGAAVKGTAAAKGTVTTVVAVAAPSDLRVLAGSIDEKILPLALGRRSASGEIEPAAAKGLERTAWELSPLAHVRRDAPSVLLLHGQADAVVPAKQSIDLRDALKKLGNDVKCVVVPKRQHLWDGFEEQQREVLAWLAQQMTER